jgi:hypothetical protein
MASLFDKFAAHRTRYNADAGDVSQSGIETSAASRPMPNLPTFAKSRSQRRTQQAAEEYKKLPDGVVAVAPAGLHLTLTRLVGMIARPWRADHGRH